MNLTLYKQTKAKDWLTIAWLTFYAIHADRNEMRDHKQNHRWRWKQSNYMLSVDVISGDEMNFLYWMKIDLHPLWHGWVHAQKNLRIHFYLIYILTEKVPLRKALGTETWCQFWRKLNFIGTNATQMQLVHNNLFHFLYYNSIIYFFDSMNMTATHQNNHPTPNLNLLELWPDRCLKVKVVNFDLEFLWPSSRSGLSCGLTSVHLSWEVNLSLQDHKLLGYQEMYVELSVIFKVVNPSGPLKSFSMSTSRGWRCPLMIIEWSGPPRSQEANSRSVPERMAWSSAPTRARPTHTVSSVIAALKERT